MFFSSALDYNDITTQIYRLHIFSKRLQEGYCPNSQFDEDIELMNGREAHAKRGNERIRSSPDSIIDEGPD
jgi:hypothetical protein